MAHGVSLEALAMAGESHLSVDINVDEWERREELESESPPPHLLADESLVSVDIDVDEWERREELESESPPPHLLADESHLSVDIYVDEWECREELESELPPPHLLADDVVNVTGDSSYCGEEWRSKKAVDMKRCLSCWVQKVVSDAAKSKLIISGQERS